MDQTQERTLKQALSDAAAVGFTTVSNTFDGGRHISMADDRRVQTLSFSIEWGEESEAVRRIDAFVALHSHRSEDDPHVQHEGTYTS